MSDSLFRREFAYLTQECRGRRVEWPQLLRHLAYREVARIKQAGKPYTGKNVFIDRDGRASQHQHRTQKSEELEVYRLYKEAHTRQGGCITLNESRVWLISCQVPNQSNQRGRRADLLGLREDGSLVVFECKVESNKSDSPLKALLEGLDYLAHLLIPENLKKLNSGFGTWKSKSRGKEVLSVIPDTFANVGIQSDARHGVFSLAPQQYYALHRCDAKRVSQQWWLLSDRHWPKAKPPVELDFACVDYATGEASLLDIEAFAYDPRTTPTSTSRLARRRLRRPGRTAD